MENVTILNGTRATRADIGDDDYTAATLITNFASPGVCRFPSTCGFNDNNILATLQGSPTVEPNSCTGPGGAQNFDNTVWFRVNTGSIEGIMDIRVDSATGGLKPLFLIAPYDTSTNTPVFDEGTCDIANAISGVYSDSFTIQGNIAMAVASQNPPGNEGNYRVLLNWDPDSDRDGRVDSADRCPTQAGPSNLRGCPDSDGDGIPNIDDRCDTLRGPASLRGCPDSDGDGIANVDDRCDTLRGPASLGGCPDSDGDGLIDPSDSCPRTPSRGKTDKNANGCPDYKAIPDLKVSVTGKVKGNKVVGAVFKALRFRSKAPRGTKIRIKCKPRKTCKLRKRGSLKKRLRFVSFKRKKTKITIKATKRGYVGKVFTLTVGYKSVGGGGRNVFLKGPTKKCIPVGRSRSTKCTGSLLLR